VHHSTTTRYACTGSCYVAIPTPAPARTAGRHMLRLEFLPKLKFTPRQDAHRGCFGVWYNSQPNSQSAFHHHTACNKLSNTPQVTPPSSPQTMPTSAANIDHCYGIKPCQTICCMQHEPINTTHTMLHKAPGLLPIYKRITAVQFGHTPMTPGNSTPWLPNYHLHPWRCSQIPPFAPGCPTSGLKLYELHHVSH
jgi:hypothetical protein